MLSLLVVTGGMLDLLFGLDIVDDCYGDAICAVHPTKRNPFAERSEIYYNSSFPSTRPLHNSSQIPGHPSSESFTTVTSSFTLPGRPASHPACTMLSCAVSRCCCDKANATAPNSRRIKSCRVCPGDGDIGRFRCLVEGMCDFLHKPRKFK